jgi:AraC family transcriptional regulator of arabinose operon
MCQHLREKIAIEALAEVVGLSSSRLSYLFKRQNGITPQQYFEQQRLERARQLLELTDLPVKAIAADVGFDNPFYFTLRFKRHLGESPREYRNHVRKTLARTTTDRGRNRRDPSLRLTRHGALQKL